MIASSGWKEGNPARCDHARNRSKAASQLLFNGSASLRIVPGAGKVHFECEDTVDAEPEVHSLQAIVARQQHAGANQQCQRERELNGRQHIAKLSLRP